MKSWFSKIFILLFSLLFFFYMFLMWNFVYKDCLSVLIEINFLNLNFFSIPLIFLIDKNTMIFSFTVILISLSVFIFSFNYMLYEIHMMRFHTILSLFVFSMLLLIFSPGLFSLFLGWDGLGLSSFLLVIYYNNSKSLNAGMLTFLTNRFGDGLLLVGAGVGFWALNFNIYLIWSNSFSWVFLSFLILGAITKSAQVPFSAWLPAAMAAPTPVSSLVHSSTLVTAGIYLLFRLYDIFNNFCLKFLLVIGVLTMMLASLSALTEVDMKKIVALSTLSQLGLMVMALGLCQPGLSFFHLIVHAFFKALMFIAVGTVMHMENSYQDLKVMGKGGAHPLVLGILVGANFSLSGLPFFSGFFSKEAIIQVSSNGFIEMSLMLYFIFILSVLLTQLYSIRFFFKVILLSFYYKSLSNFSEEGMNSKVAMSILIFPSVGTGMTLTNSWGLTFEASLDPGVLKFFLVSILFLSLLFSMKFMFVNFLKPKQWWMFNMWFLPWFSGMMPSKMSLFIEAPKTMYLMNFFDYSLVYMLKLMFLNFKDKMNSFPLMFFEILILSLILIMFIII